MLAAEVAVEEVEVEEEEEEGEQEVKCWQEVAMAAVAVAGAESCGGGSLRQSAEATNMQSRYR